MRIVKQSKGVVSLVLSLWVFVLSTAAVVPSVHHLLHDTSANACHGDGCEHGNKSDMPSDGGKHVCAVTLLAKGFDHAVAEVWVECQLSIVQTALIHDCGRLASGVAVRACIRAPPVS